MVYVIARNNTLKILWGSTVSAPSAPARWESYSPRAVLSRFKK